MIYVVYVALHVFMLPLKLTGKVSCVRISHCCDVMLLEVAKIPSLPSHLTATLCIVFAALPFIRAPNVHPMQLRKAHGNKFEFLNIICCFHSWKFLFLCNLFIV